MDALALLLHRAFDDAGLFPPAARPMDEAAARHAAVRRGPHAALVGRLVAPVNWLPDLGDWLQAHPEAADDPHDPEDENDGPWRISVLGTSLEGFRQDLAAVERFEARHGSRAAVEAYEVKALPDDVTAAALKPVANSAFEAAYVELPLDRDSTAAWHTLADSGFVGAKARLGGLEAPAFPDSERVAAFLREVLSLDLPFKLTSGLRHPLPHVDRGTGARAHGFLTVILAAGAADAHDLSTAEVRRILDETDAEAFWFRPEGLGWRDCELDIVQLGEFSTLFGAVGVADVEAAFASLRGLGLPV